MSGVVHAIFEPAHVFWGTCCIFDQRKPRQVHTRISLCYEYTQSMDEDKDLKQNFDPKSNSMSQKSLTDQRNATLACGMPH